MISQNKRVCMNRHSSESLARKKNLVSWAAMLVVLFAFFVSSSCKIYSFKDVSIPNEVKTIHINYIENKARILNPQLSPQLTDQLKQKINNQTRLTQVPNDNADYDISGYVSDYNVT